MPSKVMKVWIVPSTSTPMQRAEHEAAAAGQQGAADDDGGDRVELHADRVQAVAGERVEREQQPAERRAEPADRVDADLGAATGSPISSADGSLPPSA